MSDERDTVGGMIDPSNMKGLGSNRTTAEVVADVVAKNPAAHGLTVEERKRRAIEEARRRAQEDEEFFREEGEE